MKKISVLLMIMSLSAIAAAKSVVFTLNDGSLIYYLLGGETNPVMKFVDGKIVVNADEYELSGIKNFYISDTDDPNGIEQVFDKLDISYKANLFVVKGNAQSVKVFSTNGTEVEAEVTTSDGYVMVNLNGLAKGTYIINVGKSSFKVMKK